MSVAAVLVEPVEMVPGDPSRAVRRAVGDRDLDARWASSGGDVPVVAPRRRVRPARGVGVVGLPVVRALVVVAVRAEPTRRQGTAPGRPRADPAPAGAGPLRGRGAVVFEGSGHHPGRGGSLRGGVLRELRPPLDCPHARKGGVGLSARPAPRRRARRGPPPAAPVPVVGRAGRDDRVRRLHGTRGRGDRDRRHRSGHRPRVEAFSGTPRRRRGRAVAPAGRRLQVGPPSRRAGRRLRPGPTRHRW